MHTNKSLADLCMLLIYLLLTSVCVQCGKIPSAETLLTALQDEYKFLRGKWRSVIFRISMCVLGFLLGLPQTTQVSEPLLCHPNILLSNYLLPPSSCWGFHKPHRSVNPSLASLTFFSPTTSYLPLPAGASTNHAGQ